MRIIRRTQVYAQLVQIGEAADMFHSFAVCRGEVLCAFRRHVLVDMYGGADFAAHYDSEIWMRRFDLAAGNWANAPAWRCQAAGEDPRLVVVRDRPYMLSAVPPGQDANYILYDVDADVARNVEVTGWTRPQYGKNWQPFVHNGELYAVHGFQPFRVLHIDVATGRAEVVFERAVGLREVTGHDHFTRYRGGGAADLIKALPLQLLAPRPLARAISTAGGIALAEIDAAYMLRRRPGDQVGHPRHHPGTGHRLRRLFPARARLPDRRHPNPGRCGRPPRRPSAFSGGKLRHQPRFGGKNRSHGGRKILHPRANPPRLAARPRPGRGRNPRHPPRGPAG